MSILSGFQNSKKQGDAGLAVAIGWFALNKYTVSIPLSDSQDYDLIVEQNNLMSRVQVKTTTSKRKETFVCNLKVCGGNRSGTGKSKYFDASKCEYLFVLCDDGDKFLIPSVEIDGMAALNMNAWKDFRI